MTKQDLIEAVAKKADGMTKKAVTELVETVFETLATTVKKQKRFSYPGFGTFTLRTRAARKGHNPQTHEPIKIKASKYVHFKGAKSLKDSL